MGRVFFALLFSMMILAGGLAGTAKAQQAWIQIEAQPTLSLAERSARNYAGRLSDVNGFALGGGWYGLALGPYSEADAASRLLQLRASGEIPRDSFIADGRGFRQQFWPVGANAGANASASATIPVTPAASEPETPAEPATPVVMEEPEETPAQARRSEAALSRDDRRELQTALQWFGFYTSAIDGAFGPGTRRSMRDWQASKGHDATGILTTRQRAELLGEYSAIFDALGLAVVVDDKAGIEVTMPTALVKFDRYEAPFAHYGPSGDRDMRVLLISQSGDESTLLGLYDIMQTLKIVPLEGERSKSGNAFTLTGSDGEISSYTHARLKDGRIKGFTLIWKNGEDPRVMARVTGLMRDTLAETGDGVLDPSYGDTSEQSLDLVAGLEIRKPEMSRSGFYVDAKGTVVTTADVVENCTRVTIDNDYEAKVAATDEALGLAVLTPTQALSPLAHATLLDGAPRLRSDIAVSGYSFGGLLGAPTVTYGTLADLRGLGGEANVARLAVAVQDADAGGPVLDQGGVVMGVLLERGHGATTLPADVQFAAQAGAVGALLSQVGAPVKSAPSSASIDPVDLVSLASDMTVLVSCWR
ncbi:MAG: serine protease [Brevirhabdus sp.]